MIFFLVSYANAQITVELDSIVVSASRVMTTVSESGKNVSVITQNEIRQMPVTSVDELLRSLPGVNINSRQGFGVQADVGIRGSTFSQVLFMLDNVPLNDPLTAHFNTNIPVSLAEIGQIELIRGPASASFGANAVGGVVHIKTRTYLEREINRGEDWIVRTNADVGGGQHNLLVSDVSVDVQKNRWRISNSIRRVFSDGEELANPGFADGASDETVYNNYFELFNYTGSVSYRFNENLTFYTRGGYDSRAFSARYFYTRNIFDEAEEEISARWLLSALTYVTPKSRVELNASYRSVDDLFIFNPAFPANSHTTDQLFLNVSHEVSLLESGGSVPASLREARLLYGAQYTGRKIESTDRGNHTADTGGFYVIGTLGTTGGLSVTGAGRVQFETGNEIEFLPQLNAAYNTGNLTFRASAGRAIRTGDFTERYISSQIPDLSPGRNIGNPDLRPEKSWTFDAGIDWNPSDWFRFSPTAFYRTSSNLIDYTLTNSNNIGNAGNLQPDEYYFYANNIASSKTRGVELLMRLSTRLAAGWNAHLNTGYTYISTTGDGEDVSKYIANHPGHQFNLGFRLAGRRISVHSETGYYVRSSEAEQLVGDDVPSGYLISNLKIQTSPFSYPVLFYVKVMNLTDTRYQEILGAPMPRRWVMGGIQLQFTNL